jgi:hypothetical protein
MELETTIDPVQGIRRHTIRGQVSGPELVAALREFYAGFPDAVPMKSLWDLTGAEVALASEEVKALSELVGKHWGKAGSIRSAIVVSEDLAFGLGRMYESLLAAKARSPVLICRTLEEAEGWLSQDPADEDGPGPGPA